MKTLCGWGGVARASLDPPQQRPGWRNVTYGQAWPRSVRVYAFPRIDAWEQLTDVVLDFLSRCDDPHRVAASRFVRALEWSPMRLRLHLVLR